MSAVQLRRAASILVVLLALGAAACDTSASIASEYHAPVGTLAARTSN